MINIIVLIGPSNSGKDYIRKRFADKYDFVEYLKPYTTRDKRDNESDDDYYFNNIPEGFDIVEKRSYELANGKNVEYGTVFHKHMSDTNEKIYVLCGTLEMLINLVCDLFNNEEKSLMWSGKEVKICPVFIKTNPMRRLIKAVERASESGEDPTEVCRRFLADSKDFSDEKIKSFNEHYKSIDRKYLSDFKIIENDYHLSNLSMGLWFADILINAGYSYDLFKGFHYEE